MWGSPTHPGPKLNPTWAKLWNKLECNAIHNVFKDYGANTPYNSEECAQYLKNNDTYIHFQGEYIPRVKFLETWDTLVRHATASLTTVDDTNAIESIPS